MILKYLQDQSGLGIPEELGITPEREIELMRVLFAMHEQILGDRRSKNLTAYYARIAEACSTLEEYTMCMHLFIFYLARHGLLHNEIADYEKSKQTASSN